MRIPKIRHRWSVSNKQAVEIQKNLAREVRQVRPDAPVRIVAGVDAAYSADAKNCIAGVVLWDMWEKVVLEQHTGKYKLLFPYIPGLLSFREAPAVIAALCKLKKTPDVILCDGQGIAHPRRLGIASHIGVLTGLATIGCAKNRLVGSYVEPASPKGSMSPLMDGKELIGTVIRTRDMIRPVFVSIGHLIDLRTAEKVVLACAVKFRLPEPIRLADHLVTEAKRITSWNRNGRANTP